MTGPAGWWLLRHAPTEGPAGRFVGRADRAVATLAPGDAAALAERIGVVDVAVLTPARRTRQTLDWLVAGGLAVAERRVEPELLEQDFGAWEEQAYDRLAREDPAYWPFWDDPCGRAPPGGESYAALFERAVAAFRRLDRSLMGARVLHVGHAGPIRALLTSARGGVAETALALPVAHLSLARLACADPAPAPLAGAAPGMIGSAPPAGCDGGRARRMREGAASGSGTT